MKEVNQFFHTDCDGWFISEQFDFRARISAFAQKTQIPFCPNGKLESAN